MRVPDAFTAVVVQPLSTSTFPFLGSDRKYHVAYDLELTNASSVPATIRKLDVVDAHHPSKVLDSISARELIDATCPYGNCNRLHSRDLTSDNAWIGGQIPEGSPVAQVEISKIGVREIVVEGTTGSVLRSGPGHLRTSPLPGQVGNAVIAGRRVAYGGPFRHLDALRPGDRIVTTTSQGRSTYRVSRVTEISRRSKDAIDDFGDNRLTLMTSTPELKASRRLVVTAALATTPRTAPTARAADIHRAELGLHSDGSSTFALLLWAQVALVASVATAWLRRRWRPWPTYLVALPVLALLILLVFDSLTAEQPVPQEPGPAVVHCVG